MKHGLEIISTCKSFRLGTKYAVLTLPDCYNVYLVSFFSTLEEKVQWMKVVRVSTTKFNVFHTIIQCIGTTGCIV